MKKAHLIAIVLIVVVAGSLAMQPRKPEFTGKAISGAAIISVNPVSQEVNLSRQVMIDINIADVNDLYGYQLSLSYNPFILRLKEITEGSFLSKGFTESSWFTNGTHDAAQGTITNIANTRMGDIGGVSGSGKLLSIRFETIAEGQSSLKITEALLSDQNQGGGPTPAQNGTVTVSVAQVEILNNRYSPQTLQISAGESVKWINSDSVAHTVTSDTGIWDSNNIAPGASHTRAFTSVGTFGYHCTLHPPQQFPAFTGQIIVTAFCSDGTPYGQCSTAPQYCDSGSLINKCSMCGCPSGQVCKQDESCGPPSAVCGNGAIETGEQCDDGNTNGGDGCSSGCQNDIVPIECFLPGTKVVTTKGLKNIEHLRVGDELLSYDSEENKQSISRVEITRIFQRDSYYRINDDLEATDIHPMAVLDENNNIIWKEVQDISIGERLFSEDGNYVIVQTIQKINLENQIDVYNPQISYPNTYYVIINDIPVLTHNKNGNGGGCTSGKTKPCGSNIGACVQGIQTCVNKKWSGCVGSTGPRNEVCDGLDNDCDTQFDEGLSCNVQCVADESCGSTDVGACEFGTRACVNNQLAQCEGSIEPVAEVHGDSIDNDCDGQTDEVSIDITAICTNSIQDWDEEGVDCGGSCPNECERATEPIAGPLLTALGIIIIGVMLLFYFRTRIGF